MKGLFGFECMAVLVKCPFKREVGRGGGGVRHKVGATTIAVVRYY